MPINYKDYPANWKTEIKPHILKRAENCCENCGVENYFIGYRNTEGVFFSVENTMQSETDSFDNPRKIIKIVLTIAHLNHDIANNDYENLKALCQKCHNRHDIADRMKNRKETLKLKSKQLSFL